MLFEATKFVVICYDNSRWEDSFFVFKTKKKEKKNPPEILKRKDRGGKEESGEVIEARKNRSPRSDPN